MPTSTVIAEWNKIRWIHLETLGVVSVDKCVLLGSSKSSKELLYIALIVGRHRPQRSNSGELYLKSRLLPSLQASPTSPSPYADVHRTLSPQTHHRQQPAQSHRKYSYPQVALEPQSEVQKSSQDVPHASRSSPQSHRGRSMPMRATYRRSRCLCESPVVPAP